MKSGAKFNSVAVAMIVSLALTGCESIQPNGTVPQEYKSGQAVFHKICANCHGPDADGSIKRAPALTQSIYFKGNFDDRKIRRTILKGSPSGAMPSQKNRVEKSEVKEIVKYLRYLQKEKRGEDQTMSG
ncbi:MAG: c-type cytochrome [Candidatus Nitronauta litoralis]|uniref:C-type cytochrome n=1 Tax=Candidatus Nitronauta litoralis TaxID=2705533 RepID=A0A7T0BVE5_9BACT|nr:MAG: c-type cytochrome [Candidatus Nitronauta litoralis]